MQIALAWEALRILGAPRGPATVFAVASVMHVVFGPALGTLVDRWRARVAIRFSETLFALVVFAYAVCARSREARPFLE